MKSKQKSSWGDVYLHGRNQERREGSEERKQKALMYRRYFFPPFLLAFWWDFIWRPWCKNSLCFQKALHQVTGTRINLCALVSPYNIVGSKAMIIGIVVISLQAGTEEKSILSRWAWLTKEDKSLEGFNQKQYSLYFNLNCCQVYIKLCFQQCSSPSSCFVLKSLGKQVLPLYLRLLYWFTSLTCSVILLFYLDQC